MPKKPHELLQFFAHGHLAPELQPLVMEFAEVAKFLDAKLGDNTQKTLALQKLIEAKDCAVRSKILAGALVTANTSPIIGD